MLPRVIRHRSSEGVWLRAESAQKIRGLQKCQFSSSLDWIVDGHLHLRGINIIGCLSSELRFKSANIRCSFCLSCALIRVPWWYIGFWCYAANLCENPNSNFVTRVGYLRGYCLLGERVLAIHFLDPSSYFMMYYWRVLQKLPLSVVSYRVFHSILMH